MIQTILIVWGFIQAPIHEIGHMIFGWLSFNPTCIIGWTEAAVTRDGFIVGIGGYITSFMAAPLFAWKLRRHWWAYAVAAIQVASTFYYLPYQADFVQGTTEAAGAMVVWSLCGVLSVVGIVMAMVKAIEEHDTMRRIELRRKAVRDAELARQKVRSRMNPALHAIQLDRRDGFTGRTQVYRKAY